MRYELDWLLQMQDETTGGVYHKLTSKAFVPLDVMPDTCSVPMYLSPISSTATGDFAGVCAYASLFYRQTDPVYADTLVQAAKKAYAWLKAHPDVPGFKNPPGISTGEYGDEDDSDERALAAAALCLATEEPDYPLDLRPPLGKSTGTGWEDMGLYAVLLYLQMPRARRDEALFIKAKETLLGKARELLKLHHRFRVNGRRASAPPPVGQRKGSHARHAGRRSKQRPPGRYRQRASERSPAGQAVYRSLGRLRLQ